VEVRADHFSYVPNLCHYKAYFLKARGAIGVTRYLGHPEAAGISRTVKLVDTDLMRRYKGPA
jgi:hypothetical protein